MLADDWFPPKLKAQANTLRLLFCLRSYGRFTHAWTAKQAAPALRLEAACCPPSTGLVISALSLPAGQGRAALARGC